MEAEEGFTKAEGGVSKPKAGNMESERGVTEAEAGNMEAEEGVTEAEGGVTKAEAKNMEAEEGVTKADGEVMEADLEEAIEAEGGVTEPHLEEAADHEGGITKAKEVARKMECVVGHNIVQQLQSIQVEHESHVTNDFHAGGDHETLSDTLAVEDVFAVKANDEEMEYWLLRCTARKHKITTKEVRCLWNTKHIFMRDEVVVYGKYFEFQKKLKGPKFIYVEAKKKDPVVIYSHLVQAVKIRMASMPPMGKQQDTTRFSFDNETHEQILTALLESEAPPFEKV
ncbi:hypothetical protein R1flu_016690 [Riccia fluitans]|uniref:Uncharacterized protein n=1 Tax=Riccia fluitans TaxID=41844 RepID=A0ABD1YQN5_9MARC